MKKLLILLGLTIAGTIPATAQVATGDTYTLNQAVVSAGGGTSADTNGVYKLEGVIGEPIAGTTSSNSPYVIRGGFLNSPLLGPTAAGATVSGRVLTRDGRGIRNVTVTMVNFNGTIRTATSSAFGYFSFTEVPSGETYIFSATAKRFAFDQPTQVFSVTQDTDGIVFVGSLIDENSPVRQRAND